MIRLHGLWGGVLLGWLALGLAGGLLALAILFGGLYDTRADNPHLNIVAWAVHRTMIGSVRQRADDDSPLPPVSGARLLTGARDYEAHCLACHGGPGVARAPWASALLPTPPFLIDARTRWTPAELRELVTHGVKMSAMPAWGEILPPDRIDNLVWFIELLPRLDAAHYQRLRAQLRTPP